MKKFPFLLLFILSVSVKVQAQDIKELGLMLENYEYPYPVSFYHFNAQKHAYKMAYMYIQPGQNNGKTVTLLHGKNFNGA